jgi:RimJ/RimL family protein N-acetyltransferase
MYFKKLVGKKCYLSPIDKDDAEKFTGWLNDLELTVNLGMYSSIFNVENERELLGNISKEHGYSIIDLENDELIGSCGFTGIDHLNQTAEIGLFIGNKDYWNKGFGSEALTLLVDYGFKALNLHNIWLKTLSFNARAIKSYGKVGFGIIGRRRESILRGNERYDTILMELLYNEFYENNKIIMEINENKK